MVEAPKFEYKYDLALWKSFSARLSVAILVIAAGVFLIAMLTYLYLSEESVKESSAVEARIQLHDAVMAMRIQTAESALRGDTLGMEDYVSILRTVKPYKHAFTLMTDRSGRLVYVGDSVLLMNQRDEVPTILRMMGSGEAGMQEVFKHADISLLIHEPRVVTRQVLSARGRIFFRAICHWFFMVVLPLLWGCWCCSPVVLSPSIAS